MKVTVPSDRRYYRDEDQVVNFDGGKKAIYFLRDVITKSYNAYYDHVIGEGTNQDFLTLSQVTIYDYMRCISKLGSLYINALEPFVKSVLNSQLTNYQNHIEDVESAAEQIESKTESLEEDLEKKQAVKKAIITYTKTGAWEKPYPKCTIKIDEKGQLTGKNIPSQYFKFYENKLDQDIRRLKTNMKNLQFAARRKRDKAEKMKTTQMPHAIFGTKQLYKQKDTIGNTPEWHEAFEYARYHTISLAGVKRSPNGNYVVKWDEYSHDLTFCLPDGGITVFHNFLPYRYTKEFIDLLKNQNAGKNSVGYTIELKKDSAGREYFIVKATFDLPKKEHVNNSTVTGIISVDINPDLIAWYNIDENGVTIEHGDIPMKLEGLNSGQRAIVIGSAIKKLAKICVDAKKPLGIEKLDASSMRRNMRYQNKKRNRIISTFSVTKIIQFIRSQAYRNDFAVFEINPAYTSLISKVVHMRKMGVSVHDGAAYEVGLRILGLQTEVPEKYTGLIKEYPEDCKGKNNKYMFRWKCVYEALKKIRPHAFYLDVPEDAAPTKTAITTWFKDYDTIFTTSGKKYLAKFGAVWEPSKKKVKPTIANNDTSQPLAAGENPFMPAEEPVAIPA